MATTEWARKHGLATAWVGRDKLAAAWARMARSAIVGGERVER